MSSAQGNSITGLLSIIGYVFLFFVLMNIIIQGLFHLVMELSDDVIGWVGGIGKSQMGKDTEGKVSSTFLALGRFGSTGVAQMSAKGPGGGGGGGATPNSGGKK